jgi:hypothetical protein
LAFGFWLLTFALVGMHCVPALPPAGCAAPKGGSKNGIDFKQQN